MKCAASTEWPTTYHQNHRPQSSGSNARLQVGAYSAIYQLLVSKWVSGKRVILATSELGLLNEESKGACFG